MSRRMDPEIKAQWIAWLRDPNHEQGFGHLEMHGKYCCLGGLCELAVEAGVPQRHSASPSWVDNDGITYFYGDHSILPSVVMDWAGLSSSRGEIVELLELSPPNELTPVLWMLVELNDSREFTFSQIADIIDYFL